ncbi:MULTISPECIES: helix-turn-helix transcriptional regulator [Amycolatopsis]|uniref:LuxR C-terminal-related transcriptional regulator n=1 Tax=Amycolatopsis albidoflavus TaxID=102226 RepID=A0ABW5I7R9_9PSEU
MDRLRVAVHADDPLTHCGVTSWLRTSERLEVVPSRLGPGTGVLVLATGPTSRDVLGSLARACPAGNLLRLVLLVNHASEQDLAAVALTGIVFVLPRATAQPGQLVRAVLDAGSRPALGSADAMTALRRQLSRAQRELRPHHDRAGLSPREVDVLRMLSAGWDTAEIAEALSYSERTVKNLIHRMLKRLNLRNRTHAVAYAVRTGIV